ncbi:hypothetical protein GIB67_029227 [Kingdonia uniflora]|uniref:Uncharacterized protein n=1 Tax=Kingdonia uniflora TaxID=39325 RepID=A0A7J7NBB5_9MAGN|nr:hypothetical protein GIB67_029227 [Kingdonia uniflora]
MDRKEENGQKGIQMDERNLTSQIGGETSKKPKSTLGFPKITTPPHNNITQPPSHNVHPKTKTQTLPPRNHRNQQNYQKKSNTNLPK